MITALQNTKRQSKTWLRGQVMGYPLWVHRSISYIYWHHIICNICYDSMTMISVITNCIIKRFHCKSLDVECRWALLHLRLYIDYAPWIVSGQCIFFFNEVGGGYTGFTLSVRLSVCPSVCRRHGFRSISQVCFGISISNFICMLMVAIGRSLLIFSDVTFKMAAWRPYWIFWFPDSNFALALNINFKLQRHNTYVYG